MCIAGSVARSSTRLSATARSFTSRLAPSSTPRAFVLQHTSLLARRLRGSLSRTVCPDTKSLAETSAISGAHNDA